MSTKNTGDTQYYEISNEVDELIARCNFSINSTGGGTINIELIDGGKIKNFTNSSVELKTLIDNALEASAKYLN